MLILYFQSYPEKITSEKKILNKNLKTHLILKLIFFEITVDNFFETTYHFLS